MKTLNNSLLLLLLPLLMISLLPTSLCDQTTTDLIHTVCSQTSDFAFCEGTLERNLKTPKTNLPALTELTVNLTLSIGRDTLTFIMQSEAAEKDEKVRQLYGVCQDSYEAVVGFMEKAAFFAVKTNFKRMVQLLKVSDKPVNVCQTAIAPVSPRMLEKNRLFRVLLSAALFEGSLLS